MVRLFREPLLYFLLLGGALFALYQAVSYDGFGGGELEEIVVSEGHINALLQGFEKTWQRPPTRKELDGLIQNYIRDEVMYREALALGFDRDDPVVRRRLRQKLQFYTEDLAALEEPADSELQSFLDANAESYRQSSRFSFRQVYINRSERGSGAETDALKLLDDLRTGKVDAADSGDNLMLGQQFDNQADWEIERALGRQFLQGLLESPGESWQGPIVSGFGLHLVYITHRIEGEVPELDAVRDQVNRDWSAQKREQFNEALYQKMRERYKVTIDDPASGASLNAGSGRVTG